jgi:hypothetical protein
MKNILADHMRVFVAGDVSVQSLSIAAQAERVDRETANRVLTLLAGWESGAGTMNDLRSSIDNLI